MSLTASAPPSVESYIKSSLALRHPVVISQLLNRSDIYMSVVKKSSVSVISIIIQFTDGMPDRSVFERILSGVAASLRTCSDPRTYPKTVIFCKINGRKLFVMCTSTSKFHRNLLM